MRDTFLERIEICKDHRDEIEVPDPLNEEDLISYNKIVNEQKQG